MIRRTHIAAVEVRCRHVVNISVYKWARVRTTKQGFVGVIREEVYVDNFSLQEGDTPHYIIDYK